MTGARPIAFYLVPDISHGICEIVPEKRTWYDSSGRGTYMVAPTVDLDGKLSHRVAVFYTNEQEDTVATPYIPNWIIS